ncbi:MAG: PDZ domain-containing protein [Planctomycetota bacterium]
MRLCFLFILVFSTLNASGCKPEPHVTAPIVSGVIPTMRCEDLFVAETFIDGRGPFWMLLDTGAGITTLTPETAEKLDGTPARSIKVGELSLTGRIRYRVAEMDHLVPAIGLPLDGILGHEVFEPVLLVYDFPKGEIRYRSGSLSDDEPGVAPMSKGNKPRVGALLGDTKFNILLDTGYNGGLAINQGYRELPFEFGPIQSGVQSRLKEGEIGIRLAGRLATNATFGAFTVERPIVQNAINSHLLGTEILGRFVVTIDQRRGRVQMVLPDGTELHEAVTMPSETSVGAAFRPSDDGLVIEVVYPGMPAAEAGLREGDAIVAFSGEAWIAGDCASRELARSSTGGTVTIERDGERFEVTLRSAVLVP